MAAHKSTRFRDERSPLKGGNRIRTHPRRVASAEGKASSPGPMRTQKGRRGTASLPDQMCIESIQKQLVILVAGVTTCALALEHQRADRDVDVASTLKGLIVEELWRMHALMDELSSLSRHAKG